MKNRAVFPIDIDFGRGFWYYNNICEELSETAGEKARCAFFRDMRKETIMNTPKAALIMGSDSDFPKVKGCVEKLKSFGIEVDVNVISAHRTPDAAAEFLSLIHI